MSQRVAKTFQARRGRTSTVFGLTIVGALISFVGLIYLARRLGLEEMGEYGLGIGLAVAGAAISTQWLQQGLIRLLPFRLPRVGSTPPAEIRARIWRWMSPPVVVAMIIGFATGKASDYHVEILPPSLLLLGAMAANGVWIAVLQASGLPSAFASSRLIDVALRVGSAVLATWLVAPDARSALWGSALGGSIAAASTAFTVRRHGAHDAREFRTGLELTAIARYGVPMVGWFACSSYFASGDRVILSLLLEPSHLGAYVVMAGLAWGTAAIAVAPALAIVQPRMMRAWDEGNTAEPRRLAAEGAELCLAAGAIGTAGIVVGGNVLIGVVFGAEYASYWPVAALLFAAAMVWQCSLFLHKPLEFLGNTTRMLWSIVVAVVCAIIVSVWITPTWGATGAALALLIGVATYAASVVASSGLARPTLRWRLLLITSMPTLAVAVMAVSISDFRHTSTPQLLGSLAVWALAAGLSGMHALKFLRPDRPSEA